jgi:hypothetical protein
MSKKFLLMSGLGFAIVFFAGCGQQAGEIDKVCPAGLTKEKAVSVCEDVLRDFNFTVAKADANEGVIISRPLRAGQFFEFWRKDNVGSSNATEANLHSIRRTVEMNINQADGQLCLSCKVRVQRLSLSEPVEKQIGIEYDRTAGRNIKTTALQLDLGNTSKQWLELGNDEKLASKILKKIETRTAK